MTTNYHTPWIDDTTQFKASHMNAPLSELDTQITINYNAIDDAKQVLYAVCYENTVVCYENEVVSII